jgi:hypothetical protein
VLASVDGRSSGGQIGVLGGRIRHLPAAGLGAVPFVLRVLPSHAVLLLEFWTWAGRRRVRRLAEAARPLVASFLLDDARDPVHRLGGTRIPARADTRTT